MLYWTNHKIILRSIEVLELDWNVNLPFSPLAQSLCHQVPLANCSLDWDQIMTYKYTRLIFIMGPLILPVTQKEVVLTSWTIYLFNQHLVAYFPLAKK